MQFTKPTVQELQKFIRQTIQAYSTQMFEDSEFSDLASATRYAREEIYDYLQCKINHQLFIAKQEEKEEPVGYLWFTLQQKEGKPHAFLAYIFVNEEKRQQGIAKQLMTFYETTTIQQHNAITSTLYVSKQNTAAKQLYHRFGYEFVLEKAFHHAQKPTRIKMVKTL